MTTLSAKNIETLRALVERKGLTTVARALGVPRFGLGSVLIGRGRHCTNAAIAAAYLAKARELEAL
jgi:hypothetical protein